MPRSPACQKSMPHSLGRVARFENLWSSFFVHSNAIAYALVKFFSVHSWYPEGVDICSLATLSNGWAAAAKPPKRSLYAALERCRRDHGVCW